MPNDERPLASVPVLALLASTFCWAAAALAATTALGKLVYDLTSRELDLGLLGLVEFAPAALLVLVTGSVADRFDRRRVASFGIGIEAAAALGLIAYVASGPSSVGPIFGIVVVFGTGRAFAAPAARSLPADIVEPERVPWLIARYSASWQLAIIVGPVLGGTLYAVDERYPFVAMFALLVLAAVLVQLVRPEPGVTPVARAVATEPVGREDTPAAPRADLHQALEGLRFIRGHPVLLGAISLDLFAVLFGGAVALLPAIAEDRLHVDAVGLGWLRAAGGIGAALVTILLARRPLRERVGRTLLAVVAVFGVGTIALGLTRSFVVAFIAMAVLSGADAVSVFIRATLVPLVTPPDKRGRVLAVENVFIGASNELGAFESGVAGQVLGPSGAIVLGGVATLAISVGWWVIFPALRDVDRFPERVADVAAPPP
ncbi:MAG: MFS transporter [Acidimicrobiales bacterium]